MTTDEEREFWDELILNDDGTVDLDAVYNELHDYRTLMEHATRVYWDITCGRVSKANTHASEVIGVANECVDNQIREEIYSVLLDIEDDTMTLDEALNEYGPDVQTGDNGI